MFKKKKKGKKEAEQLLCYQRPNIFHDTMYLRVELEVYPQAV